MLGVSVIDVGNPLVRETAGVVPFNMPFEQVCASGGSDHVDRLVMNPDELGPDPVAGLDLAVALGITGVELRMAWGANVITLDDEQLARLAGLIRERGLVVVALALAAVQGLVSVLSHRYSVTPARSASPLSMLPSPLLSSHTLPDSSA